MADLKPGWRKVKLGDVVERHVERTDDIDSYPLFVGVDHLDSENLRLRRYGDARNESLPPTFRYVFRQGMVLVPTRRPRLRKCVLAPFDGLTGEKILVLKPRSGAAILAEFLPHLMSSPKVQDWNIDKEVGSVTPHFRWADMAELEFTLPPLLEQRRMAAVLDAHRETEEALRNSANAADSLEASMLLYEFGTYSMSARDGYVPLSRVAAIQSGVAKGRAAEPGTTMEVPYLRVANVKDGFLDLEDIQCITVERTRLSSYLLRPGDVLMTEGGDLDKLGRGTVWQGEIERCVHQNHVFSVRTDALRLNPWYLAVLARSTFGRGYFQKCAKRTSNLASVNKRELGELPIPLRPLSHQSSFVAIWQSLRAKRSAIEMRVTQLRVQRTAALSECGVCA